MSGAVGARFEEMDQLLERVDAHAKTLDKMEHDAKKLKRAELGRQRRERDGKTQGWVASLQPAGSPVAQKNLPRRGADAPAAQATPEWNPQKLAENLQRDTFGVVTMTYDEERRCARVFNATDPPLMQQTFEELDQNPRNGILGVEEMEEFLLMDAWFLFLE